MNHVIVVPDSPLKRQTDIAKYLCEFVPKEIANIISGYDYHLEGVSTKFSDSKGHLVGVLSDGKILCQESFGLIKIWNIDSTDNEYHIMLDVRINQYYSCWTEMPNNTVAIGDTNGTVSIFYIGADEPTIQSRIGGKPYRLPYAILMNHCHNLMWVKYISNGLIVCASNNNVLKIWNVHCDDYLHPKEISKPYLDLKPTHGYKITTISVLPDHKVACGLIRCDEPSDPLIEIWNILNGVCESVLRGHESDVSMVMPILDHYIASWSHTNGELKIWNIKNKERVEIKTDITITNCCPMYNCDSRYKCSNTKSTFFGQGYIYLRSLSRFNDTIKIIDCNKIRDFAGKLSESELHTQIRALAQPIDITLEGNFVFRTKCLILPDNRIFGPSNFPYGGLRIRDLFGSDQTIVLPYSGEYDFWLLPDGRVISYSSSGTIKIWH